MTGDEHIDLDAIDAVVADDALVERLRSALSPVDAVVWDDDDDDDAEDLSYALLRALQRDVSADIDAAPLLVPGVVPLAAPRRLLGRGAAVAVVAAGVLSLAGAAAAASSSPGDALYGVRSAVSSAVSSAVHDALDAVTPSEPVGPVTAAPGVATPTATVSPRGAQVSAAARSASAVLQIDERLTLAGKLLDAGRAQAAGEVLDQAARRLTLVSDLAVRSGFQHRIDLLRARAAALTPAHGKPSDRPDPARGQGASHKPDATPSHNARSQRDPSAAPGAKVPTPASSRRAEPRGPKPVGPVLPVLPAPAVSAQSR